MERIFIAKLSENEPIVEMHGVSVTSSPLNLLKAGKHPSHCVTDIISAALRRIGINAELSDVGLMRKIVFKEC